MMRDYARRVKRPAHGVHDRPDRTTVVFVTVATVHRQSWLACDPVHAHLCEVWRDATGWLVGPYLIMPNHLHFLATRGDLDCSLERWISYWKRRFARTLPPGHPLLQENHWDTRIRNGAHFSEIWEYIRHNPVRQGLVATPDDWVYQGVVHTWSYIGP